MKKKLVGLMMLVVMIVSVCALAACGGVAGTYKLYSVTVLGHEYKLSDAADELKELGLDFSEYTMKLNSDGTVVVTMELGGEKMTEEGTWEEKDDGKVSITIGGDAQTFQVDGNKLIMESLGQKMTFKK